MILLDTHVLIWLSGDPERLSKNARQAIREARATTGIAITTMTLLELARFEENHKLGIASSLERFVGETISRVIVKPMTPEIVALAVRLPATFPKDPADRVIAATAMAESIALVTADQRIRESGLVETIW